MSLINIPSNGSDNYKEPVSSSGALPASGGEGEIRLTLDTGELYYWDGDSWELVVAAGTGGGITTLNGLSVSVQSFAVGTSGSDVNISSSTSTHTFNIPDAGSAARGLVSTGAQNFAGDKTFDNNVIVTGDLTVQGTQTIFNTNIVEIEDSNIILNNGGDDASSEGAGITIERTSTNGSIIFAAAAASKFKMGLVGSEIEVVDISSAQSLTNKTIDADNNTISNLEIDNLKTGVLDTDLSSVSASHDTLPSAKATKDYVDGEITGISQYKPEGIITLSAGDIIAKSISLSAAPSEPAKTRLTPINGVAQEYGADFTVSGSTLSWNALGLDGVLETGDKLLIEYN